MSAGRELMRKVDVLPFEEALLKTRWYLRTLFNKRRVSVGLPVCSPR